MRLPALLFPLVVLACEGSPEGDGNTSDPERTETESETETDSMDQETVDVATETAERLALWLEGDYDSQDQEDRDYSYYAISLRMCRVDLPALGDRVLYVEQALMDAQDAPYRQRLYRVEPIDDTTAVSEVWQAKRVPTETELVGLCDNPEAFDFRKAAFEERPGCGVIMTWDGETFSGGTNEDDCESDLNGATYATAEVTLSPDLLTSWDRGYTAEGIQVWGAEDGAYEFVRRTATPSVE